MEVVKIVPQGYCKGVYNAIKMALETKRENPNEKIYILGLIIHNKLIKEKLEELRIITLVSKEKSRKMLIEEIEQGIVILTAHGTDRDLISLLEKKGLKYVDTTCTYVKSTYKIIEEEIANGHEVVYIGIRNHPEATATCSINKDKIHLIEKVEDLDNLNISDPSFLITNQTTLSYDNIIKIYDEAQKKYPLSRLSNEQCSATRLRQNAIINLDEEIDLVLVVGDFLSNNSIQLTNLAKKSREAYLIESIEDIDINWLKGKKKIGVTSGASTPFSLVEEIIDFLNNYEENKQYDLKRDKNKDILKEFKKA